MPFEVPKGWVWTTLGEICTFLSRGKSPKYSEERKFPVFAQKCNLKEGGISLKLARFLDPSTSDKWEESYKLKTGDILINSTGTGTVGRTRLFDESFLGAYPFVVPDSHVSVVRTSTKIVSEYVYAYVSSLSTQLYLEENLAGSTNQKELYIGVIERLPLPLPPLAEQQRIVSEIERWSVLIDTIEQGKENLEISIKQAKGKILDLAIHGKLVPQDPSDEPASELLKRINPKAQITCDNEHYAQLPKGWSICELMDVAKIVTGSTPSKSDLSYYGGNFPLYKPSDLDAGRHTNTASEYLTTKGRDVSRIIPPNSIAVCCIGSIGKVGYIEQEGTTNQQINTAIPSLAIFPDYLYHLCTSTYFQNSLMEKSSAVTISIVNKSKMEHIKIPLPPKEEQARIVVAIDNLFNALDAVKENL